MNWISVYSTSWGQVYLYRETLAKKGRVMQLEYYLSVTFNELMDLGNDQWSSMAAKERQSNIICIVVDDVVYIQLSLKDQSIYSPRSGSVGYSRLMIQFLQELIQKGAALLKVMSPSWG